MEQLPVIFGHESLGDIGIGTVELNRPAVLNALDTYCYELLESRLLRWRDDDAIGAIIMSGVNGSKAFCAGGDVKQLVLRGKDSGLEIAKDFFTREYFVDGLIHGFKKPVIAVCDGITMGGGLGLAAGAFYRIATERTMVAMPELSIGFFPDVGATRFLRGFNSRRVRAPYGLFMGLTGARLSGVDAVRIGLMDGWLPSERIRHLRVDCLRALANCGDATSESARDALKNVLMRHCLSAETLNQNVSNPMIPSMNKDDQRVIEDIFSYENLLEIDNKFLAARKISPWLEETRERYKSGSPLSRAVFFAAWQKHRDLAITETLTREWEIAIHFSKEREFSEGVRAVLIDKDHAPAWTYKTLADVPSEAVAACFESGEPANSLAEKFREFGW